MYSSTKRRRTSMSSTASLASRGDDDTASLDLDYQPDPKRKKVVKYTDPTEQCQKLYDIIRNHKREDGAILCEAFIRVPKRRQEPEYYTVVNNPMDMLRIQQKIKLEEYEDVEQMSVDVDLMVSNAKAFYKKSSQEYKDACDLWDLFIDSKCRLVDQDSQSENGDGKGKIILKMGKLARRAAAAEARRPLSQDLDPGETSESSTATDRQDESSLDDTLKANLEELFSAVMLATDTDGRLLATEFQLLPSRKRYPTYYDLIECPIDLKMIAVKIQTGEYGALPELEKDLLLMCRNACTFNETGSQIYKDAKALKKIVAAKRAEIENSRTNIASTPGKTSERIRNRKLRGGISHSAITAALQYEDDEDEDEEMEEVEEEQEDEEMEGEDAGDEDDEGEDMSDSTNPMWLLYESVATSPGAGPFKRLPSRHLYPDYYQEIKHPTSLAQIRMKLRTNEYMNPTEVQADLNVMFENAKTYNRPDSQLYRTAVKMQKQMQAKVQELLLGDDVEEEEELDEEASETKTAVSNILAESDSDTNQGTGSNNSSFNESGTAVASKSMSAAKKSKPKPKEPQVITTPGPLFGKSRTPTKDEKNNGAPSPKELLRKRYMTLFRTLVEYAEPDGRVPIALFMEKPSRKAYPDYYKIISEPIDMVTIESNIQADKYATTDDLLKDFTLMFDNCRLFNEEGSLIYEDANKLEKMVHDKIRELGPEVGFRIKPKKTKKDPATLQKMRRLLDVVRDFKDVKGRQLSAIFQKLPSKMEYPEYYEVIKNPIDLDRMYQKLKTNSYDSLDHLVQDLTLMFDNCYKFNEPDSQVYKDALVLQRLALQTKLNMSEDDDGIPDVRTAVREILLSIFTSVYNHKDEEGRCYSDTLAELPEFDEVDGQKVRGLTLDGIKLRMDRGYYKRLDTFQKDVFKCLERCRNLSRTDSQLFEDSVELQSCFIKVRDELCGQGKVLRSPALKYTKADLDSSVEALREEKKQKELPQDEDTSSIEIKKEETAASQSSQSESYNETTYNVGDFVYVAPTPGYNNTSDATSGAENSGAAKTGALKPNVACIQKLWTDSDGIKMFEGIFFFRPDQTYHIPTRKFLQKELFRSEVRTSHPMSDIIGKCWVMTVKGKEYFNYAPEGYADEDVYVCEYRYSSRGRCFTKLKSWAFGSDRVKLLPRPKPLEPIRVASVFSNTVDKQKEELLQMEDDALENAQPEQFQNVEMMMPAGGKEGFVFYEQYVLPCGPIRCGDYVYVRVENTKKLVARVDTMWYDSNVTNFHGPWFTALNEISPTSVPPGRTFYKQEIFQSSIEDTNPLLSICGRCCVLDVNDYVKYRPTEIPEEDVYVCESLYDEARRQIKKLENLKKISRNHPLAHQDEIYYFRRPVTLTKVDLDGTPIPEMPKLKAATKIEAASPAVIAKPDPESIVEDSMDGSPPSLNEVPIVGTPSAPGTPAPAPVTPSAKKTTKTPGKKIVTGYILYSSEVRKFVAEKNPTSSFGEISRIVGNDWRKMTAPEKQVYEERAARMNEEKEQAMLAGIDISTPVKSKDASKQEAEFQAALSSLKKDPDWIFECCWKNCEWQFEDAADLVEHCIQEPKGHVARYFAELNPNGSTTEGEFQCQWKNCARVKKGVHPFPSLGRLLKHVKDIHIMKGNGRIIHPDMRSKNLVVSRSPKARASRGFKVPNNSASSNMNGNASGGANAKGGPPRKSVGALSQSPSSASSSTSVNIPQGGIPHDSGGVNGAGASCVPMASPQIVQQPVQPPEPLFVAVPPRPQKLLHSEAYIRYIESLHSDQRYITNWDNALKATQDTTPAPEPEKLPANWLAHGAGPHESILDALWSLRNFMMCDMLNLAPNTKNQQQTQPQQQQQQQPFP